MNEPTKLTEDTKPSAKGFLTRGAEIWQWLVVLFLAFVVLALLSDHSKLAAPGAPAVLFWITIGIGSLIVFAHAPPLFMRLPPKGRGGAYLSVLAYIFLLGFTRSQVGAAWEKTPQGAAEAKQYEAKRDAEIAEGVRRRAHEAELQEAQELQEEVAAIAERLESCFTTFGHRLPALEKSVKDGLHNPEAFEHVETLAIVPDADRNNVAMKFRAENGFGAIRLGLVKASVDPDTCEVVSQSEPLPL